MLVRMCLFWVRSEVSAAPRGTSKLRTYEVFTFVGSALLRISLQFHGCPRFSDAVSSAFILRCTRGGTGARRFLGAAPVRTTLLRSRLEVASKSRLRLPRPDLQDSLSAEEDRFD